MLEEGGVEWVADQAAITVQELREVGKMEIWQVWRFFLLSKVVRRLAHGERRGRAPHGLPFIAIWSLPRDLCPDFYLFTCHCNLICAAIYILNPCSKNINRRPITHCTLPKMSFESLLWILFMVSDQKWLQEVTTETWFKNLRKLSR